ncbi:MAG: diguanylate cyclase [Gammaproteobacteria bacterium]|nr:diguanylate cyclase [Gammaproteobacteria bacterium]
MLPLRLITLGVDASAMDALRMLSFHAASSLLLVDDGRPAGIFTERDVTRHAARIIASPDSPVTDFMSAPVISARRDVDLRHAYGLFSTNGIRHLVLVDESGRAQGIISEDDLIQRLGIEYFVEIKTAAQIMMTDIVTHDPAEPLAGIIDAMSAQDITCIVAATDSRPVGILTERDLVRICEQHRYINELSLSDVMSAPVKTTNMTANMHECILRMQEDRIRRLVIINDAGEIAGLVTQTEVMAALEGRYAEYLREVLKQRELELKTAQAELTEHAVLDHILRSSVDTGLLATDLQMNPQYLNTAAEKILPAVKDQLCKRILGDGEINNTVSEGRSFGFRIVADSDDNPRHFGVNTSGIFNEKSELSGYLITINEITRRILAENRLRKTVETYQTLFDEQPSLFFILNENSEILSVNRYGIEQLGYEREDIQGHHIKKLIHPEDSGVLREFLRSADNNISETMVARLTMPAGQDAVAWYKFSKRLLAQEEHERVILLVGHDFTEAYRDSERLSYEATHDALTGLINVRMFRQRLERILQSVKMDDSEHALCYMDLDRFKEVNDRFGHHVGDRLLTELAELLMQKVRKRDILARLGGDEFGLLIEHCNVKQVERVTNTLLETVRDYRLKLPEGDQQIGVSIGVVAINRDSGDYDSVLQAADKACYRAKRMGRNRICFAE